MGNKVELIICPCCDEFIKIKVNEVTDEDFICECGTLLFLSDFGIGEKGIRVEYSSYHYLSNVAMIMPDNFIPNI